MELTAMVQPQQYRGYLGLEFERVLAGDARRRWAERRAGSMWPGHGRDAECWMLDVETRLEYPQPAVWDTLLGIGIHVEHHAVRRGSPS